MSNLVELRDRVVPLLMDTSNAIWDNVTIDEAIRQALDEYTAVFPLTVETVITLPGDGREIALNNLAGLIEVQEVWWPYDSEAASEPWPPNKVRGWRVCWDDAQPVLFLDILGGSQAQQNDEVRLWYFRRHTIQDLDSADSTTIRSDHESHLVKGHGGALRPLEDGGSDGGFGHEPIRDGTAGYMGTGEGEGVGGFPGGAAAQ